MAISGLSFVCRPILVPRIPRASCFRKVRFSSIVAIQALDEPEFLVESKSSSLGAKVGEGNGGKPPEWKRLNSKELGISTSMIAKPTRKVLNALRRKGYEVYLVGGCVRDLILNRTPKDFDVITSAELKEVMRTFSWCEIIGRRFPICHVHIGDDIVEVSSFSTIGKRFGGDFRQCDEGPIDCDRKDYVRWRNCLQRDFTINGLLFDPYAKLVYDYMGGLEDIRKAKVHTIIPASTSFQDDCARILRGVRIAARLGFRFSRETAHCVKNLSHLISRLDKSRLMMEMNYMLAYGSAEASLRLLWKFGLLEILLPIQAAYFVRHGFKRRDKRSNMLLCLFSNLDRLLAPDRPCHGSLWFGILAFHKAVSDQPQNPMVVAAFCLALHNGGDMSEAVDIARRITRPYDVSLPELSEPQDLDTKSLVAEVVDLAASVKLVLSKMTDEYYVSQAMSDYPKAPQSDMVFIPLALYLKVLRMFECIQKHGRERGCVPKLGKKINYELLAMGNLEEVRHVFARIVFDTIYPLTLTQSRTM
ncbi:hypothetical protein K2173_027569 [Erythroxylum novogranatense]|uniref:Polynucleotide adenylyltransferase n=1 Tax=Erythroxylum novogranatense TaxID=1862640 RepID=A0AAV8TZE1_9ROSI|nr:hypothetical protein K2173_027569 [Erythroxylum novogranatense]